MTVRMPMRVRAATILFPKPKRLRCSPSLSRDPALVLAVSGGPDSTALLWLAARWRDGLERPPKLIAVTVDHGLREESAREALAVKRLAGKLEGRAPHAALDRQEAEDRHPGGRAQRALSPARRRPRARPARRYILTAHTLDDQAETVLFRLARGSGVSGLARDAADGVAGAGRGRSVGRAT